MTARPASAAPLDREQADQALAALGPAYDRIATAMFALDGHQGLVFLRNGNLTGTSQQVSEHVQALMTMLWGQFTALRRQLERAREIRAARSRPGDEELAQLTRLLRDPVVVLAEDGTPLEGAQPGTGPVQWLTLAELAQSLETTTAELADLLSEVDGAVSAMTGRLATLTDQLGEVQAMAGADDEAVAHLAAALDDACAQGLADPIEVARGGAHAAAVGDRLSRLTADLDSAKRRLADLARVRDDYPQRVAELSELINELAAAELAAGQAYEAVRVKIANPGLPEVPASAGEARERLAGLDRLAAEGSWARLVDELSELDRRLSESTAYARRLQEAADGLLDRRAELRGRLGAYRAKAARLGYGEHPALSARHREAHTLLYTSPCDLPGATRAVFAYQQALADLLDPKETVR